MNRRHIFITVFLLISLFGIIARGEGPRYVTIQEELAIYHKNEALAQRGVGYYDAVKVMQRVFEDYNLDIPFDTLGIDSDSRHGLTSFYGIVKAVNKNGLTAVPAKINFDDLLRLSQYYTVITIVGGNRLYAQIISVGKNNVRVFIPGFANSQYPMPLNIFKRDWDGKVILINDGAIDIDRSKIISEDQLLLGDGCGNCPGDKEKKCEKKSPNQMVIRSGKLIEEVTDFKIPHKNIPIEFTRTYRQNIETEVGGWEPDRTYGSSWAVVNGKYMGSGHITVTNQKWINPDIMVEMQTIYPGQSLIEVGCVTFCFADPKNRYNFFIAQGGYLFLAKHVNNLYPTSFLIDGMASNIDPLQTNKINIKYNNGNIKVYINGSLKIDITDPNPLPQGEVGLESHLSRSLFDNVTIKDGVNTLQSDFSKDDNQFIFGYGWYFSYSINVKEYNEYAVIQRPDGRKDTFTKKPDGSFSPPPRITDILTKTGSGYTLTEKDGVKYIFDLDGKLKQIIDTNNNTITLDYTGTKPSQITDSVGRIIQLEYGINGMVEKVTDPAGNEYSYYYEGDLLIAISDPMDNIRNYFYDSGTLNVTTIESGSCGCGGDGTTYGFMAEYIYNDQVSKQTDSEGNTKFVDYLGHTTVITNTKGESHSYDFGVPKGVFPLIQSETDRKGKMTKYKWDDAGNLIQKIDRNNNYYYYTYDKMANVTYEKDPEGNETFYTYTPDYNKIKTIKDANGKTTTYEYDTKGNLTKIINPDTSEHKMIYTPDGLIDIITDPKGDTTNYDYDNYGNITKGTDALGNKTQFAYDIMGNPLSTTDANNNTTYFEYNNTGNLIKKISPSPFNYETSYEYDEKGNLIRTTLPNGKKVEYEYTPSGKISVIKDYIDSINYNETTFTYDSTNLLEHGSVVMTAYTDPNGNTTKYEYDEIDRLTRIIDAEGNITQFEYDNEDNITRITDANGNETKYTYSGASSLKKIEYMDNTYELFDYDKVGNVISKTDRNGKTIIYTYDSLNRLTKITYPNSTTVQFEYDKLGNITKITDQIGITTYTYDSLNRLTQVTYPDTKKITYTYDPTGNITHIYYPNGDIIQHKYDQLNRNTDILRNNQLVTNLIYDNLNRRIQRKLGNNIETQYGYDNLNRLTAINSQISSINYEYDNAGNITKKETNEGAFFYQYDKIYRLTNIELPDGRVITYNYDPTGNRQTQENNGITSQYSHNNVNQLLNYANNNGSTGNKVSVTGIVKDKHIDKVTVNTKQAQISGDTFTAEGVELTDGENIITVTAKDTVGNTTTKQTKAQLAKQGNTIYKYDKNGNMIEKAIDSKATKYEYDYENRLTKVFTEGQKQTLWQDNLNPPKTTWVGNAGTNCTISSTGKVTVISNTPQGFGYVVTEPITITVDSTTTVEIKIDSVDTGANYTLVVKDITLASPQPEYKFANQKTTPGINTANLKSAFGYEGQRKYLIYIWAGGGAGKGIQADYVSIYNNQSGNTVEFKYDGLGRRVQKTVNGTVTKYLYDRENVIEEYNSNNQLHRTNIFSLNIDEILQAINYQPSTINYYYSHDHLGSVTEITNQNGVVIEKYDYDPFGNPQIIDPATGSLRKESVIGNRYMFTAREWDTETGLCYYRERYYDPKAGRFISEDPIGVQGGINFYTYVFNNPINLIDPFGLKVVCKEIKRTKDEIKRKLVDKHVEKGTWKLNDYRVEEVYLGWILYCNWARDVMITYTYLVTSMLTIVDRCVNTCTGETWTVKMTGYTTDEEKKIEWKTEKTTTQAFTGIPPSLSGSECMRIRPSD